MEYNKSQSISRAELTPSSYQTEQISLELGTNNSSSTFVAGELESVDLNSNLDSNVADDTATLSIKTESIWVSMPNGEQLHMRHMLPLYSKPKSDARLDFAAGVDAATEFTESNDQARPPKRVFMLHGEVECGRIFYDDSGKGLANYLAEQGYEVFVADLGGRGRSLGCEGKASSLSVHDVVTEAIPRLLRAASNRTSGQDVYCAGAGSEKPSIWVAHGFGGVLLSAAWARMDKTDRSATQMIFFGARRKLQANHRLAAAFVKVFCHPLTAKLVNWHSAFPATRMRLGSADENAQWFRVYTQWMTSDQWCDPEDGFDYRAALQANPIPSAIHFAAAGDKVYADAADVRAFVEELGCHDARLIVLDEISNSTQQYDHLSMLLDPAAVDDVFSYAGRWLKEQDGIAALAQQTAAMQYSDRQYSSAADDLSSSENDAIIYSSESGQHSSATEVSQTDTERHQQEKELVLCA